MSSFDEYLQQKPAGSAAPASDFDAYLARTPNGQQTGRASPPNPPQSPSVDPGILASSGAGLGYGFGKAMLGAQQFVGHGLSAMGADTVGPWLSRDAEQGISKLDAEYAPFKQAHPVAAGAGDIVGQMGGFLVPAGGAARFGGLAAKWFPSLGRVGSVLQGVGARAGPVLRGAGLGAVNGLISPERDLRSDDAGGDNYWSQKAGDVGLNAMLGGGGTAAMRGLGAAVRGVADPVRQRLADAGVLMTPGQLAGGAWHTLESKLTSVPVLGDMIRQGQQRSVESFNRAAYQRALSPIGSQLPAGIPTGSDAVEAVGDAIGRRYDALASRASFAADAQFRGDLAAARNQLAQEAPAMLAQFDNIVQHQVSGKLDRGLMSGEQWNDSRSMITRAARNQVLGNASPDNHALGHALRDVNDALTAGVARSSAPEVAQGLGPANAAYAQYKQIERAAGSMGASNNGNVFSPAQYMNAVRAGSTLRQRASNSGLNAGFAEDAQNVLGRTYPDSGTAGRLGAAGALGAVLTKPSTLLNPFMLAGLAPSLAYTGAGQRVAQSLFMNRPEMMRAAGDAISNRVAPLAPGLLSAFMGRQ